MNSRIDMQGVGMTSARTRARLIARLRQQGISDETVLEVMQAVPRHLFVDEALSHRAYEDSALPIGFNQTISQPYTVARMTELLLEGRRPSRVLEIGTGCGYQAAAPLSSIRVASRLAWTAARTSPTLDTTVSVCSLPTRSLGVCSPPVTANSLSRHLYALCPPEAWVCAHRMS